MSLIDGKSEEASGAFNKRKAAKTALIILTETYKMFGPLKICIFISLYSGDDLLFIFKYSKGS